MTADLSQFFVTFKTYVITEDGRKLDKNLILRFRAFTEDAQRELYRQWIASIDAMHFLRAVKKKEKILFKVETFRIDTKSGIATFKLPCRESVKIDLSDYIDEITAHEIMMSYIVGIPKLVRNKKYSYYILDDVEIYVGRANTDVAKELLKEYEPLDLIAYSLGYKPTPEVKALILPRILPLFTTNEDASGTHVLSLTSPSLGKSECAKILSELSQAYFSPFFPATTKLIGDARTNTYGLAYHYNTIYVDEFLHGDSANNLRENYNAILTGMENAKWSRERGAIDFERTVSFGLFGNIKDESLNDYNLSSYSSNNREIVESILRDKLKLDMIDAFMQRITYVEYLPIKDYQIMQDLNRDENGNVLYLDPYVARGIIKIIAERVLKVERLKKNPRNRYERHMNRLYAILKALELDVDEDTIEKLVYGDITFWDIRHELFMSSNPRKPKVENERVEEKENIDDVEDIDFSTESALGIERESFDDFFNNSSDAETPDAEIIVVDGGYIEYKVEITSDAQDDVKREVEYVVVEITEDLGERNEIVGIDGRTYKLEKGKRISLPYENARILVKHDIAKAIHPPDFVLEAEQKDKYVSVWFVDCQHVGSFCNGKRLCRIKGEWVKEDVCRSCRSVSESKRSECVSKAIV